MRLLIRCFQEIRPLSAFLTAVCLILNMARENNFAETVFLVKDSDVFQLHCFTSEGEIDFCGHCTLASAFVSLSFYDKVASSVRFRTLVGLLTVQSQDDYLVMDLPAYKCYRILVTEEMSGAIGCILRSLFLTEICLWCLRQTSRL